MKPLRVAALIVALSTAATAANAQGNPPPAPPAAPPAMAPMGAPESPPMQHPMAMQQMAGMPTEPGQAAFGAAQEIVGMLLADPTTNWSKADIDALRQHLIDMNEVTMRADARKTPIDRGLRITVTGSGRTLAAIRRMLPTHAQDINGLYGWTVQAKAIPDGEELTVTAGTPADVQKIRALGFMGIMVLGRHQMHHLAMAKGEPMAMH